MAVPKFKSSKSRTRRKHSINSKLKLPTLVVSKDSGALVRAHNLDSSTGTYNGKNIISVDNN